MLQSLQLPAAARRQEQTIPFDWTLRERARNLHPAVVWWWGERSMPTREHTHRDERDTYAGCPACDGAMEFGAFCYLCDSMVTTWSRAYPITQQARSAVLVHRDLHLMGRIPTPGDPAAGIPSTAERNTSQGAEQ